VAPGTRDTGARVWGHRPECRETPRRIRLPIRQAHSRGSLAGVKGEIFGDSCEAPFSWLVREDAAVSFRDRFVPRPGRLGPADIVGVPVLPPARLAGFTTAVRSVLERAHRSTAPPPVHILEALLGVLDSAALAAICRLGVPEHLQHPTTVDALAETVGADVEHLERVIRFAATRGWIRLGPGRRVAPTRTTPFLRADHPGGWRAWVEFASSTEVLAAIGALSASTAGGGRAFENAHGASFFAWMAAHPDRHAVFDAAMDAGGRLHALALSAALPWSTSRRVCDVGGGTGALISGLLDAHPHLHGVLVDLPEVVARAPSHDRIKVVGGDAFTGVPPGCDTYLFVNVLHDWGDDQAITLLTRVAEALQPASRVIVVEAERPSRPHDTIGTRTDLLMLILTGAGKERTTGEFAELGTRAGLRLDRSVHLASADRAHVFVPTNPTEFRPTAQTAP
jgi:O-methyltransferase domain